MLKQKILLLLLINFNVLFSQDNIVDSLKFEIKNAKHDSSRFNFLMELGDRFQNLNSDSALFYHNKAVSIAKKISDTNKMADATRQTGWDYYLIGEYDKALIAYEAAINFAQKNIASNNLSIKNRAKKIKAAAIGNTAGVYYARGLYAKALENYFQSLKIAEEINNKKIQASNLANIGLVYDDQQEYKKALQYYSKSLKLVKEIGHKRATAISLANIGTAYNNLKLYPNALDYYLQALKINEEIGSISGIASTLGNLGNVYENLGDQKKALEYFQLGIQKNQESGSKEGISINLSNIGSLYTTQKKFSEAEKSLQQSLKLAKEIGYMEMIKKTNEQLSYLYEITNRKAMAFEYYKAFIAARDSMMNEENIKAGIEKEMAFNYEKKAAADSVKVQEEKKAASIKLEASEAKLKQEKTQRLALYGGLSLVIVFAGFMFNRYKITQKQKQIIELKERETYNQNIVIKQQKHLVEEKHKEITDSINYAERIQRSFLASKEVLDENLKEYFIYFKPKDIVSGDFYWADKINNGQFLLATADSTGHGVPGAIMSLLNITSIEKAVEHYSNPNDILNNTRQTIIKRLKKDGSAEGGKDGMDCSLISFDFKTNQMHVAAANNPVWIVRTGEIIEIKPDKMPVGKHQKDVESFTLKTIEIFEGDVVYTLTDGYPDQFGGEKGKKFMSKNLKELLAANAALPMNLQQELLETTFDNWKKNMEQVDDVTVIGIRI